VTGGTKVLSDRIKVKVTTEPGESFLDKMIALVEGASRQKTPNEIALTILLAGFTLVFIIVCITLKPFGDFANTPITIAAFISLFVCLIPTTIGGLLSAIGIAGMDRALRANVITKSGKLWKQLVISIRCCWTKQVQSPLVTGKQPFLASKGH
jgi:K+-transporting ATPase ATPase B chain